MENDGQDIINQFNNRFTTNQLSMFKIILPYINERFQKPLAIYIKFMELKYKLSAVRQICTASRESSSLSEKELSHLCNNILPFCSPDEQEKLKSMQSTLQSLKGMQEMMETMEQLKSIMPEPSAFTSSEHSDENDMMSLLMGMLSPDQKETFEHFHSELSK